MPVNFVHYTGKLLLGLDTPSLQYKVVPKIQPAQHPKIWPGQMVKKGLALGLTFT